MSVFEQVRTVAADVLQVPQDKLTASTTPEQIENQKQSWEFVSQFANATGCGMQTQLQLFKRQPPIDGYD